MLHRFLHALFGPSASESWQQAPHAASFNFFLHSQSLFLSIGWSLCNGSSALLLPALLTFVVWLLLVFKLAVNSLWMDSHFLPAGACLLAKTSVISSGLFTEQGHFSLVFFSSSNCLFIFSVLIPPLLFFCHDWPGANGHLLLVPLVPSGSGG